MTEPTTAWQATVRRHLANGYGVEDIAVTLGCNVEHVRAEVRIIRQECGLGLFYAAARERWAMGVEL